MVVGISILTLSGLFVLVLLYIKVASIDFNTRRTKALANRDKFILRIKALNNALNNSRYFLSKYENMRSKHYKVPYISAQKHWQIARQQTDSLINKVRHWNLPDPIKNEILSFREKVNFSWQYPNIFDAQLQLFWWRFLLIHNGEKNVEIVKDHIVILRNKPKESLKLCEYLMEEKFDSINQTIKEEKECGIIMTEEKESLALLPPRLKELQQIFQDHRQLSLRKIDQTTQQLDCLFTNIAEIEDVITSNQKKRIQTDEFLDYAIATQKELQNLIPTNRVLSLDPIFIHTSSLIEAGKMARTYKKFDTANKHFETSTAINQLGYSLFTISLSIQPLKDSKEHSLQKDRIKIDNFQARFFSNLNLARTSTNLEEIRSAQNASKKLSKEVSNFAKRYEKETKKLQKENEKLAMKLTEEWESLTKIVKLNNDPLKELVEKLVHEVPNNKGKQIKLRASNQKLKNTRKDITTLKKDTLKRIKSFGKKEENIKDTFFDWSPAFQQWACLQELNHTFEREQSDITRTLNYYVPNSATIAELSQTFGQLEGKIEEFNTTFRTIHTQYENLIAEFDLAANNINLISDELSNTTSMAGEWACLKSFLDQFTALIQNLNNRLEDCYRCDSYELTISELNAIKLFNNHTHLRNTILHHASQFDEYLSSTNNFIATSKELIFRANSLASDWVVLDEQGDYFSNRLKLLKEDIIKIQQIELLDITYQEWNNAQRRLDLMVIERKELEELLNWVSQLREEMSAFESDLFELVGYIKFVNDEWQCFKEAADYIHTLSTQVKDQLQKIKQKKNKYELEIAFNNFYQKRIRDLRRLKTKVYEQFGELNDQYQHGTRRLNSSWQDFQKFSFHAQFWQAYRQDISHIESQLNKGFSLLTESKQQLTFEKAIQKLQAVHKIDIDKMSIYYKELEELGFNLALVEKYLEGVQINDWGDQADFVEEQKYQINGFISSSKSSLNHNQAQGFMKEAKMLSRDLFQKIPPNQLDANEVLQRISNDINTGNIPGIFVIGDHNNVNQYKSWRD